MFFAEPPRTQYDLHFEIAGIPVRVHPLFWLVSVILGAGILQYEEYAAVGILIWISVVFVSILVHELGHAFTMRCFGESPRVVLYMLGGLAIRDSTYSMGFGKSSRGPWEQILISAAGPGAGFLLAAVVAGAVVATGGEITFERSFPLFWNFQLGVKDSGSSFPLYLLVFDLLQVNILWGLMNLLPVYPLDGGQIAREVLVVKDPWNGITRSLWVSVITGAVIAALGLVTRNFFLAILFGSLAYSSYMAVSQFRGGGGFGGGGYGGGGFGGGRPW